MMKTGRILKNLAIFGVFCIVFVCGCPEPKQPTTAGAAAGVLKSGAVKIELKPAPGLQTSYKISEFKRRNIKWEGIKEEKEAFEESSNEEKVEMVVTQRIQSVDPNGRTVAEVTINSLKYSSIVKNQPTVNFDSSSQSDPNNVLHKLTGKSFTIEFWPDNSIITISGLNILKQMFYSFTYNDRAANNILLPDTVTERHSMLQLQKEDDKPVKPGGTWSRIRTFSFGLMGIKSYEKIYKLKELREVEGHKIAAIELNAIPSAEVESKFRGHATGNFTKMFDTNDVYVGTGVIDLTAGRIDNYSEKLQASWIAALPSEAGQSSDANEPVVLRMTANRLYSIEMIK